MRRRAIRVEGNGHRFKTGFEREFGWYGSSARARTSKFFPKV